MRHSYTSVEFVRMGTSNNAVPAWVSFSRHKYVEKSSVIQEYDYHVYIGMSMDVAIEQKPSWIQDMD